MNKRYLLLIAIALLVVGVAIVLIGLYGQFFAGADSVSTITRSELSTVQSFITFGGSMVMTSFVLFILLNRLS